MLGLLGKLGRRSGSGAATSLTGMLGRAPGLESASVNRIGSGGAQSMIDAVNMAGGRGTRMGSRLPGENTPLVRQILGPKPGSGGAIGVESATQAGMDARMAQAVAARRGMMADNIRANVEASRQVRRARESALRSVGARRSGGQRSVSQGAYDAMSMLAQGYGPEANVARAMLGRVAVGAAPASSAVGSGAIAIGAGSQRMPGMFTMTPSTLKGGAAATRRGMDNMLSKVRGFGRKGGRGSQNAPLGLPAGPRVRRGNPNRAPKIKGPIVMGGRGNPNRAPRIKGPIVMGGPQTSSASGAAGAARQQSKKVNSMFRDRQIAGMNLTRRTQMGILAAGATAFAVSNRRQSGTSSGSQSITRY